MRLDKTIFRSFLITKSWFLLWLVVAVFLQLSSCSKKEDPIEPFSVKIIKPNSNRSFAVEESFNVSVVFDIKNAMSKVEMFSITLVTESGNALGPVLSNNLVWTGDTVQRAMELGDYQLNDLRSVFIKVRATIEGVTQVAFQEIYISNAQKRIGWLEVDSLQGNYRLSFFNLDTAFVLDSFVGTYYTAKVDVNNELLWLVGGRDKLLLFDVLEGRIIKELNVPDRINVLELQSSVLFVGTNSGFIYKYSVEGQLLGIIRLENDPDNLNVLGLYPFGDELFVEAQHQLTGDTLQFQVLISTGFELRSYQFDGSVRGMYNLSLNRYLQFQENGIYEFYSESGLTNLIHDASNVEAVEQISANSFALIIDGFLSLYTFNNNSLVPISNIEGARVLAFQKDINVLAVLYSNQVIYYSGLDFTQIFNRNTSQKIEVITY